jgi:hypothetical protein
MDANEEHLVEQAVDDALGGVGLTAFDKLPSDLRTQAIARYHERVAERDRESGASGGHAQSADPALRGSP